ncbi:MAG: flagellar regulator YcgR PilZN domain-containing protein [Burkholderiales bacterium]
MRLPDYLPADSRPPSSLSQWEDEDERFTVRDPQEIRFILTRILNNGQSITAYVGDGPDFALTSLLAIRPESGHLILEHGPDHAAFKRLLRATQSVLVTSQEQVQIKCVVHNPQHVVHDNRSALRVSMPQWLKRIQRRDNFRIATSITRPLICTFVLADRDPPARAEAVLLDLSVGGVALIDNHGVLQFQRGDVFEGCSIGLPEIGHVAVDLEVRAVYETPLKNGLSFRRCGCRFINLNPAAESLIQRYILRLQRDRIAKR